MNAAEETPIVLAITGASGAVYGRELLRTLLGAGRSVHVTISPSGREVWRHELGSAWGAGEPEVRAALGLPEDAGTLRLWRCDDLAAPLASGSFRTAGMVICPCSGGTLAAVAHGIDQNLIHRAASVHLKERRKLILVPRETPLSLPMIDNWRAAAVAGAVLLPAMPGWYHQPRQLHDLVAFVVARILDQLGLPQTLVAPWGGS